VRRDAIGHRGYFPAAREGHSAAIVGDMMYVFGGRLTSGRDF